MNTQDKINAYNDKMFKQIFKSSIPAMRVAELANEQKVKDAIKRLKAVGAPK